MSDNLESYFKKQLSDESSGKDDWNVPSEDVWEKVLPKIQIRKGVFIPWRYLYVLGAALFIVSALLIVKWGYLGTDKPISPKITNTETRINGLKQNEEQKESNISTAGNTKNEYQNKQIEEGGIAIDEKPVESNIIATKPEITISEISKQETGKPVNRNEIGKTERAGNSEISNNTVTEIPESNRDIRDVNYGEAVDEPIVSFAGMEPLEKTENEMANEKMQDTAFSLASDPLEFVPLKNKGKLGFGLFFLPTYNSIFISGEMSLGKIETGNKYLSTGNYGIEIKYYLSERFAVTSGVQRTKIKSWSKSNMKFAYDSSTEHDMGNGEMENTSEVPMITPFGEIDTKITYRFPSSGNLPDGELMESDFETQQEILYISIPLGIEYNIIASTKVNWFAEGGMLYNQSLNNATDFSSKVIHDGNYMKVMGEEMMNDPNYTKQFFSYYLGAGINYNLSNAFQISGSARYFDNVSKVNLQENLSTHLNGFSLKIGIIYFY